MSCLFATASSTLVCSGDAETGLDYFGARYFSGAQGRFTSPDPSPAGIAIGDPQSWNLYSYVRNRPLRSVDIGGNWATDIHRDLVSAALQGYVSAGELRALVRRQDIMDEDQSTSSSYMHAMRDGKAKQTSAAATSMMWDFVAGNIEDSKSRLGQGGTFSDLSLLRLGDAIHTVQDYTSPMHRDASGEAFPWSGIRPGSIGHWVGENSPMRDWSAIGWAIRLTMAAFMQANAQQAQSHGLTTASFDREAEKRISRFVESFYSGLRDVSPVQADAARQCALGNPAACDH